MIVETKIDSGLEPTVRPTDSPMVSIEINIAATIPATTFVLKAIDKVFLASSCFLSTLFIVTFSILIPK